jgi:5-methylcytosine-specific restriction endonuclease McrA
MPNAPKILPRTPNRDGRPPRASTTARGYGSEHRRQRARLLKTRPLCELCREQWATDLHHLDHNPHNHDDANALMLCEACHHKRAHGAGC